MNGAKDIRSYGYKVGSIPCGKANLITDVPGVKVGHCTVEENGHKTGVTAVIPCDGNVFVKKPVASVFTLNGYGKTAGPIQIEELGDDRDTDLPDQYPERWKGFGCIG